VQGEGVKDLTPETRLSFERGFGSGYIERAELTVTEFVAANGDDFDGLQDMLRDLIDQGWTVQGGGAAPIVRIQVP
jgi:hypothetical protein